MQYTQEITLELNSNTAYTTVGAKQGDNNSRIIKIHITENGSDYVIPEGYTSFFRFRKPDGKAIVNSASISEDRKTVTIVLTAQTLAVAGRGYADVVLQSGSNVLSTVSFIIIIMAAPSVGDEMASSNEFGYLSEVVTSATDTIYAAEAWAAGTRGGQQLIGQNSFTWSLSQAVGISQVAITESTFMGVVGSKPGLERIFTFTFVSSTNGNYWLLDEIDNDGITSTTYDQVIVNNIGNYGIVIQTGTPANEDKIIVTVQQADPAYNNNAKYYSELLQNLTVSATSSTIATVEKVITSSGYEFQFGLPIGPTGAAASIGNATATATQLATGQNPTVSVSVSGPPTATVLGFNFGIPAGAGSVDKVDDIGPVSGNVPLGAVRYNSDMNLSSAAQAIARANIGAITVTNPSNGWFVKYNGGNEYVTAQVDTTIANYSITSSALDTGAVTSRAISSGAIHSIALAFGAVVRDAIAQYAVGASALDTHSVTSNALAPFAVTSSALSSGAVTSNAIASSAVTSYAIASGCIESWHFSQSLWGDSRLYGSGS